MDLILRRRELLRAQPELPYTYKQVEYLETDGNQWFDSGIECTSDLGVDFKAQCLTDINAAFCGGISITDSPIYFRHHSSPYVANIYWFQYNKTNTASITSNYANKDIITVKINADTGYVELNGTALNPTSIISPVKTTGKGYGIFGRISNDGVIQSRPVRIYYFRLFKHDNILRNFIPCVRKSDNTPGMYDTVSKIFFINSGSGDFIVPE